MKTIKYIQTLFTKIDMIIQYEGSNMHNCQSNFYICPNFYYANQMRSSFGKRRQPRCSDINVVARLFVQGPNEILRESPFSFINKCTSPFNRWRDPWSPLSLWFMEELIEWSFKERYGSGMVRSKGMIQINGLVHQVQGRWTLPLLLYCLGPVTCEELDMTWQ